MERISESEIERKAETGSSLLFRPRINALIADAMANNLAVICAGTGCGKTCAVSDYMAERNIPSLWLRLSECDNNLLRFWGNYTGAIARTNKALAEELVKLGFPDGEDKLSRYIHLLNRGTSGRETAVVLDNFHFIENKAILRLVEKRMYSLLPKRPVVIICRDFPGINILKLQIKELIGFVYEEDLNFTENELNEYLCKNNVSVSRQTQRQIYLDTKGWPLSVDIAVRSMKKAPGYFGYTRSAMITNIFRYIETEVWETASHRLKRFLVRISLVSHFSAELAALLSCGDESLLNELKRQNAYIRFDCNINSFLVHHFFLKYLRTKQDILSKEEIKDTYTKAALWCAENGFHADAMGYYEKLGDYKSVVSVLRKVPAQIPQDIAELACDIFKRAPEGTAKSVDLFAAMHVRTLLYRGRLNEALELAQSYERQISELPETDPFRNRTLGVLYFNMGSIRMLMRTMDGICDFDKYYGKMQACFEKAPAERGWCRLPCGPWINLAGSAKCGGAEEFAAALSRAAKLLSGCAYGMTEGIDDLCRGELLFYQGDIRRAEPVIICALERARKFRQYPTVFMALFYIERISLLRGSRTKAELALKNMESQLDEKEFSSRLITYDIAVGWYYYALRRPDLFPEWLKEDLTAYRHAFFIENFGNQIKARYLYLMGNYPPLLTYIEEMKQRESTLYGRIEMLAIEACSRFLTKDKRAAFEVLRAAYEEASPNGIIMPFTEMGKDMRTLTASALRCPDCGIPVKWLENINRKAASYAKYQAAMVNGFKNSSENEGDNTAFLSVMEMKVIKDLYNGLTRSEIAASNNLSMGIIKQVIKSIYEKLGASNLTDFVRIVIERKLI